MSKHKTVEQIKQMRSFKEVLKEAERQGWRIERTTKGHCMCYPPEDRSRDAGGNLISPITSPARDGDPRGVRNFISAMVRAGLGGRAPQQPYPGKTSNPPCPSVAPQQPLTAVVEDEEPEWTEVEQLFSAEPVEPEVEEPVMPVDAVKNPFTTKRRIIEQTTGKLTVEQMIESFKCFLASEFDVELPAGASFKLVVADENADDMREIVLKSDGPLVELEISYSQEKETPFQTATIMSTAKDK